MLGGGGQLPLPEELQTRRREGRHTIHQAEEEQLYEGRGLLTEEEYGNPVQEASLPPQPLLQATSERLIVLYSIPTSYARKLRRFKLAGSGLSLDKKLSRLARHTSRRGAYATTLRLLFWLRSVSFLESSKRSLLIDVIDGGVATSINSPN